MDVALGLKARTGRAALVAVGGTPREPHFVERSELRLLPEGAFAPYHAAAEKLALAAMAALRASGTAQEKARSSSACSTLQSGREGTDVCVRRRRRSADGLDPDPGLRRGPCAPPHAQAILPGVVPAAGFSHLVAHSAAAEALPEFIAAPYGEGTVTLSRP